MDHPIQYVHSSAMGSTMLSPLRGTECKGLGKILGIVVGVAVAIAVPFIAPAIGAALGGGFFASIAGQALIGAGIGALGGAASSALSGGDLLKGALLGGAGGALTGGVGAWMGGAGLMTGAGSAASALPASVAPSQALLSSVAPSQAVSGALAGVAPSQAGGVLASVAPSQAGGILSTTTAVPAAAGIGTAPVAGTGVSTAFKNAALQSALSMGTQALQGMAPSQQADILKQMQAEMEVTRTQDAAAYAAQKKIFDDYYSYAKSINPEFFGQLERANETQRQNAEWADEEREMREGGYSGAAIAGERRRQVVAGSAGLNTAHTGGFLRGQAAQGAAYQTASNLYPRTPTGYSQNLRSMYDIAGQQDQDRADGIAGVMSPWRVYAAGLAERAPSTRPLV